jgi:hypothetical protein
MKITIVDWMGGTQLKDAPYKHNQVVEGTTGTAKDIAWELVESGLNVMISWDKRPESIFIFTDTRRFTQR